MDDNTRVTARVCVQNKAPYGELTQLSFVPDYQDNRNAAWAAATPALSLSMSVKGDVAALFEVGDAISLTFSKTQEPDADEKESDSGE
jgi:hypothetical protein